MKSCIGTHKRYTWNITLKGEQPCFRTLQSPLLNNLKPFKLIFSVNRMQNPLTYSSTKRAFSIILIVRLMSVGAIFLNIGFSNCWFAIGKYQLIQLKLRTFAGIVSVHPFCAQRGTPGLLL